MEQPWQVFLKESDAAMRRSDIRRGLTYDSAPGTTTRKAVSEYMRAFGWSGIGAREISSLLGRDNRDVQRALADMADLGCLRMEESITRGPKASRRKLYFSLFPSPIVNTPVDDIAALGA